MNYIKKVSDNSNHFRHFFIVKNNGTAKTKNVAIPLAV